MRSKSCKKEFEREFDRIKDQIIRKIDPERIILFGSMVKNTFTITSDIDLLIVKETSLTFKERMNYLYSHIDYNLPTDMLYYTPGEIDRLSQTNPFIKMALKEGVCVYEK